MKLSDLQFDYPENLIATEPQRPSRVMWVNQEGQPEELTLLDLIQRIPSGDAIVINNTKVLKRRLFVKDGQSSEEIEVLFLEQYKKQHKELQKKDLNQAHQIYKVLFPAKKYKVGHQFNLPNGSVMTLVEKGLPQQVEVTPALSEDDFIKWGELPLPPYIQKARELRHAQINDESWYQTAWAENPGSFAAPTASLHFTQNHIDLLQQKNVTVLEVTLHVGLGTFLPVKVQDLNDHQMHAEYYEVSENVWQTLLNFKKNKHKIWALGTTVTRTLETVARTHQLVGESQLLLQEGSEFLMVDRLMTNFHQPESTLLALVAGFSNLQTVKHNYSWAIKKEFKLFSYGDLSVWIKKD